MEAAYHSLYHNSSADKQNNVQFYSDWLIK